MLFSPLKSGHLSHQDTLSRSQKCQHLGVPQLEITHKRFEPSLKNRTRILDQPLDRCRKEMPLAMIKQTRLSSSHLHYANQVFHRDRLSGFSPSLPVAKLSTNFQSHHLIKSRKREGYGGNRIALIKMKFRGKSTWTFHLL